MPNKFDISLIPRVLSSNPSETYFKQGPGIDEPGQGTGYAGGTKSGVGVSMPGEQEEDVLRAFEGVPAWEPHVVDLARAAGLEFDDALRGVLRLVARGYLNLRQRDTVANDHWVSLTPKGQESLRSVPS